MPAANPPPNPSALTSDVVMLGQDQTITGVKNFTALPYFAKFQRLRRNVSPYLKWNPAVTTDVPTLATAGPGGVSGVVTPIHVLYNDQAKVTLLGARSVYVNPLGVDYWQNQVGGATGSGACPFAIEFDYYGKDCAVWFRNAIGTGSWFWIWVNEQPATAGPVASTANSANSLFYYRLTWGASAHRRIRIYMAGADYGGLDIGPTDTAAATPRPGYAIAIIGDSFVGGTGATSQLSSLTQTIGRILGAEVYQCGYGGSGYTNAGSFVAYGNTLRTTPMAAVLPDEIWFLGSTNDVGSSGSVTAAAAVIAWAAYQAASPSSKLRVVGVQDASGTPSAGNIANNTAIKAAAIAAGYSFFADTINENWIFGTGNSGAPNGTGNADIFCGADGLHPTQAGHDYWARRVCDDFVPLLTP